MSNQTRILIKALCAATVLASGLTFSAAPAAAAAGDIGGTVFDDQNNNGVNDGEPGVSGVAVAAYDAIGAPSGSAISGPAGDWLISGLTDGNEYRIEFTGLPGGYESSRVGADSSSSVTFATPETGNIDYAIFQPTVCEQTPPSNAILRQYGAAVSCSAVVNPAQPKDAFGLLDLTNSIPAAGRSNTTTATPMFHPAEYHIDELGNVFGIAIDNRTGDFFTAASSNYSHEFYSNDGSGGQAAIVQYGNIGGGANDLSAAGTLYRMDAITGIPSVFAVMPQQSGLIRHFECEGNTYGSSDRTTGPGLGNVVYDYANDQLFVANWEDGHIYRLSMAGAILDAYDFDVDDDGSAGYANGKVPYGLELDQDSSRLLFGTVFGREIWSIDLTAAGGFTGAAAANGAGVSVHSNSASEQLHLTVSLDLSGNPPNFLSTRLHRSISDLELLPSGELLVGLRTGCNSSPHSSYNHTGQTHVVSLGGSGLYSNDAGALDISVTGDAGREDNYGGVAYRQNTDLSVDYAVTSSDILAEAGPHGLAVFGETAPTGAASTAISPLGAIDYGTGNDPKGIAGDVGFLNIEFCENSPIEIGNRVWLDLDANGVQDPGETNLADVAITLFAADGVTVLATTVTDGSGNYIFDETDGVELNTSYIIGFDATTTSTALPGGSSPTLLIETTANVATGGNTDEIDSDVVSNQISVTTGGAGANDHSLDAGYTLPYDLALTKAYTSDTFGNTTDGVIEIGSDVTFTITVTNQGAVAANAITITDYLPTGFSLNDPAWTGNGDGTASRSIPAIPPSGTEVVTITLTADSGAVGAKVNLAEISADDGVDIDSTPDSTPGNDNQPTAPGDPTDDVIDNSGGDEDDHDIAGVTMVAYDLALAQVYTSDTFGDPTDGVIEAGSDVTFTITVTNQGTVDANTFSVIDYLPAGFVLNDPGWTDNGDGTATFTGGPLISGSNTDITITLTAVSSGAGDLVNWAEISTDDGSDVDSTPDTNVSNDAQPAAVGDPTDDVIDNSGGDEDDHDPAGVTVQAYDLALTKAYTSDTFGDTTDGVIEDGASVTFTIEVTNQGTVDATTFTVTDYLPAGFDLNDPAWTGNGDGTAQIDLGPLVSGASTTVTITTTANGAADGQSVNWAEISADDGNDADSTPDTTVGNDNQPAAAGDPTDGVIDNTDGDEDDHDPAAVVVGSYDLALTKVYTSDTSADGNTSDGQIQVGDDVTFTVTVTNQGSVNATSFTVTDYLPAGFTLNDPAWSENGDGTASITAGPLTTSNSVDIPITMTANTGTGEQVNWAEISADDGTDVDSTPDVDVSNDNQPTGPGQPTDDVTDNTGGDEDDHDPAAVTIDNYDLALTKVYTSDTFGNTTDGLIEVGSAVTFTITVTNQGSLDATAVTITDYLPTGFSLNDPAWTDNGDGTASIAAPAIVAGASESVTITLTADSGAVGAKVNLAEISSDDGNDDDSTPDTTPENDNQPAAPGDPTDDVIDNTGGDEDDHDIAGVTLVAYDLALTKAYTSDTFGDPSDGVIEAGSDVTFTITVTNQGTVDGATFSVIDYLPVGFDLNDPAWTDNGDGTASIAGGPLDSGDGVDITITLTAVSSGAGDLVNWAEIESDNGNDADSTPDTTVGNDAQPAAVGDPTDGVTDNTDGDEDDHDPAGVTIQAYDLALTKAYTSDTFGDPTDGVIEDGQDVTFTVTVDNQGSVDATTFTVTDYLPAGFDLNDPAWTDNGDGTASIAGGPLAAGSSVDISITLTANGAVDGQAVNWAEISADDGNDADSTPDTTVGNDNQPAAVGDPTDDVVDNTDGDEDDHDPAGVMVGSFDLALTKVYTSDTSADGNASDGQIQIGDDVTFTVTVTNQATIDATAFSITDYLPAGFALNDPAWTDNGDGTASIAAGPLSAGNSVDVPITMTANSGNGEQVNWAEISADDGNDVDSTPDATVGNDNQPAAPGDPTDDVIDNTGGDEDDHDPAAVTITSYDLALAQVYTSDTFGDSTDGVIEPGTDVTFTITVTNQGSLDATTYTVIDYLPAGFTLNDPAWTENGDGTATFTAGPLASGANTDIPITLTATSPADGDFVNWAEIATDDGFDADSTPDTDVSNDAQPAAVGDPTDDVVDNTGGDEDDHDPAGVTVQSYDLALTKVFTSDSFGDALDGVIVEGSDATFTITVTNQGTIEATTLTITDYLPAGFVLIDPAWTDNGDSTASIDAGPVAVGASIDIPITLSASGSTPGAAVNWAEISADDGNDGDSTPDATVGNDNQPAAPGDPTDDVIDNTGGDEDDHDPAGITVASFDLALAQVYTSDTYLDTTDGVVENGADVTFTITVTNQGTVDSAGYEVTDYIPSGLVLNDPAWTDNGDGTAIFVAGPLVAGDSTDITITFTVDSAPAGPIVNWAEISTDDGDDIDSTPNTDVSDDNQPTAPGQPTDDVIDNTGGDEDDHDPAGVTVEVYDLALTKAYSSDTFGDTTDAVVQPGADVTYTITVINQGTVDAVSFDVTDYIPTGFNLNDPAWTDNGDGTATITDGPLAAGATTTIDITMTAGTITPGSYVNWAEISADDGNDVDSTTNTDVSDDNQPSSPGDPTDDVTDNTGGDEDDHDPAAVGVSNYDLALLKTYTSDDFADPTDGVVQGGSNATFTINVSNQGTIDAASFSVTDYLPAGFVLNDPAWTDNGDGTATITGGPLAGGESVAIPITMTASGVADGDFVNYAEISADDGSDIDSTPDTDVANDNQPSAPGDPTDDTTNNDGGDEDDHDLAGITVSSLDLALVKVFTSDTFADPTDAVVERGSDATFTITVINQGSLDAVTFDVTDHIPTGFSLNDPTWTDNGDGTATVSGGPLVAGASVDIPITLTVDALATPGDLVNLAEISSDDGDDVDSTPNADPDDDNQPATPGDPTDDITDKTDGDEDDHDIAGISIQAYDLALTKVYLSDTSADGNSTDGLLQIGDDVTFSIEVTNQGSVDATSFELTDYAPAGFTLNDPAWTDNSDGTYALAAGPLSAGSSTQVTITFTVTSSGAGVLTNWAEISADDGNDVDSTPNTDQSDDAQPASAGDPTDGVIDNTAGDEDDHDPASVTVDAYDLALVKSYTSDTSSDGNSTDGIIAAGDNVTFTIEVFNQGTADASNIGVTDHIPTGFVLADPAWTDNGDGTATVVIPSVIAGASTRVTIELTAATASLGSSLNLAEISVDDGTDVDSTPNTDPGDDGPPVDDTTDNSGGDEDDHDPAPIEVVADFDLALIKQVDLANTSLPVVGDQDVSFTITVINQGSTPATEITVSDYVDASMWNGFDVASNPDGTTGGDAALPFTWTASGTDGLVSITGQLDGGQTLTVPVTLTVAPGADLTTLLNAAEISSAIPRNPDGSEMVGIPDADSTPDTTNDDPVVDDVTDNSGGDEDDHDIANVEAPTFSIGNQVWFDENNNGRVDTGEASIGGIPVELFADTDGDGTPDDRNGDGSIDSTDAVSVTSTNSDGLYLFSDLAPGDFIVGIGPSNWTAAGPLDGMLSSDPTEADPNTDLDGDDNGTPCNCDAGYVLTGVVNLGDGEPTGEAPDNDSTTADPNENLTVDFGFWRPNFDLALRKQLSDGANSATLTKGDTVTFTITVINQGDVTASDIEVIDYLPPELTLADSGWTPTGSGAVSRIPGPIAPGQSASLDITFTVSTDQRSTVRNLAEIRGAVPINDAGERMVMPDGRALRDVDSVADASNAESPVDDEIDNSGGDEDDHDVAIVNVTSSAPALAVTGGEALRLAYYGLIVTAAGAGLVLLANRRRRDNWVETP